LNRCAPFPIGVTGDRSLYARLLQRKLKASHHDYAKAVGMVGGVDLENGAAGLFRKPVDGEALVESIDLVVSLNFSCESKLNLRSGSLVP
jgi:hypothetical protein